MRNIRLYFPADLKIVPGIRNMIARTALTFGFSERECYQVETIVDEICNNAIEHGCSRPDAEITLEYKIEPDYLEITVKDEGGKEFNPETVRQRNELLAGNGSKSLEFLEKRGHGLFIVKRLSNSLDISVGQEGTIVRVIKKKEPEGITKTE
ncbi:MAG: ATP-binding protein [Elusimicrobia bacterium]|nr:ATP-binding protein [Elusimicrobiota bacterium]